MKRIRGGSSAGPELPFDTSTKLSTGKLKAGPSTLLRAGEIYKGWDLKAGIC